MKLVRFGPSQDEKPGIIDASGSIRDARSLVSDWNGDTINDCSLAAITADHIERLPVVATDVRLGVPLTQIGKIVGIGLNYADHAAEAGLAVPTDPIIFLKATSSLSGPYDPIRLPPDSRCVDWEVELAVIIGRNATRVGREEALSYVAGYTIANDVSERVWQTERGTQWTKGKIADTFAPLGPWLVTRDEIPDPQQLELNLWLNDHRMQSGCSKTMVFSVVELIHRVSFYTTLQAGDVIMTGTPPGVGYGMKPPRYLRGEDSLRLSISGLGEQRIPVEQIAD